MSIQNTNRQIVEARLIVEQLHRMLRKDALHRLELYQKYCYYPDEDKKWSPNLHHQGELLEALRRKLEKLN